MECFYINLAGQTQRRDFLQSSFNTHKKPGWFLTRIQAVDAAQVQQAQVPGRIRDGEKGCFLSHRQAIEASLEAPGHALILEDDAMFGPGSCARIASALAAMGEGNWDLLFTDLIIPHPPLMAAMLHMRRELGEGEQRLLDLNELNYCGATAYVVHENFKQRLLDLMGERSLDTPYDLHLRSKVQAGGARAFAAFPFPTSLSPLADQSQLQGGEGIDFYWNVFRRFIWADRDLGQVDASLQQAGDRMDPESAVFARIAGNALSTVLSQEKQ
jgi:GR25 family glycosyltransferase involved in LPS biosynthesis